MERTVRIFIASSSENGKVVEAICNLLEGSKLIDIEPKPWNRGSFHLSQTFIESLEARLGAAEFAVMVLNPDDVALIREEIRDIPRDNVLFELGLFMGRLGRDHCYIVHSDKQPKLPTDLLGVSSAIYSDPEDATPESLEKALGDACSAIVDRVCILERERLQAFCARLAGGWWERITTKQGREVSFFQAISDNTLHEIRFEDGQHFDSEGLKIGDWWSTVVGFTEEQNELIYAWEGRHPPTMQGDAVRVRGYGTLRLLSSGDQFRRGTGGFFDVDPNRMSTAQWKSIDLKRVESDEDFRTMTEGSEKKREALASEVLEKW